MPATTSAVSTNLLHSPSHSPISLIFSTVAAKGSSAHLLKAGSKRRRNQAEMKEQLSVDDLKDVVAEEREEQISKLKQRLEETEAAANTNNQATAILNKLLKDGAIKQGEDGSITVVNGPNTIGNANEQMD